MSDDPIQLNPNASARSESPKLSHTMVHWAKIAGRTVATKPRQSESLSDLKAWFAANADRVVARAERNAAKLTGRKRI